MRNIDRFRVIFFAPAVVMISGFSPGRSSLPQTVRDLNLHPQGQRIELRQRYGVSGKLISHLVPARLHRRQFHHLGHTGLVPVQLSCAGRFSFFGSRLVVMRRILFERSRSGSIQGLPLASPVPTTYGGSFVVAAVVGQIKNKIVAIFLRFVFVPLLLLQLQSDASREGPHHFPIVPTMVFMFVVNVVGQIYRSFFDFVIILFFDLLLQFPLNIQR
mmetsp:Transcript_2321/g.4972  ORF Transcript_2321/g.4972 Transcript_2321/m.4972 type:complete len:216 (-) Transcript_2321:2204-2851(-)